MPTYACLSHGLLNLGSIWLSLLQYLKVVVAMLLTTLTILTLKFYIKRLDMLLLLFKTKLAEITPQKLNPDK
jgi:hypothetical protein